MMNVKIVINENDIEMIEEKELGIIEYGKNSSKDDLRHTRQYTISIY